MIKDSIYNQKFNGVKLPRLKGKVKITLHNPTTGKNEVIEGENIVTNAVRDIMLNNYLGGIDYSKMFPLWSKWFGGILCYQNPHEVVSGSISPDNYFSYSQSQNPLIAHAGGTIIDSEHDDNAKRGNPARLSNIYTENSVKQVWEWTPSHGNGVISALSLTHKDTGDAGLGSDTYYFKNLFNPIENISYLSARIPDNNSPENVVAKYDDSHGLMFYIGDSGNFTSKTETNKITVLIKKMAIGSAGLYQDVLASNEYAKKFTVDTSLTFRIQPSYYFDENTKYLWLFTNITGFDRWNVLYTNNRVDYTVIDCENEEEVTHGTINSDTSDLVAISSERIDNYSGTRYAPDYANIIKDGNYVYLPTGSVSSSHYSTITGLKKINITNQADQSSISFNYPITNLRPTMKGGDLLIYSGAVINSGIGYQTVDAFGDTYTALMRPDKVSSYHMKVSRDTETSAFAFARSIYANKLVNTTKFNLPSSVTKSTAQSMIIEYSLISEVADDE